MANKKTKGGKGGNKGGGKSSASKQPKQNEVNKEAQLPPQERVEAVRPLWESLEQQKRVKMLTVEVQVLHERAKVLTEANKQQAVADVDSEQLDMLALGLEPTLEEVLEEGIRRLRERITTWKLWNWPGEPKDFIDSEAFRQFYVERHIREELRKFLPRDDPKLPERPAEEGFRKRMVELLNRVQLQNQRHYDEMNSKYSKDRHHKQQQQAQQGDKQTGDKQQAGDKASKDAQAAELADGGSKQQGQQQGADGSVAASGDLSAANGTAPADGTQPPQPVCMYRRRRHHASDATTAQRDTQVELINVMLEALEQEHEVLYQMLLVPIQSFILEVLPDDARETTKLELAYEDFEKLMPEDAMSIVDWLTEKVDALSTRLKAEPKEEEENEDEEVMGDVDLWALTEDAQELMVNSKWLQHLQERLLGDDGHPRKSKPAEDPHSNGLVLEWVYGSIVSTAEKARDGAKRPLGSHLPSAIDAHTSLIRALEEQHVWDTRLQQARSLLQEMLKSRLEAAELAKQYDIKPVPKNAQGEELPADDSLPDHVMVSMLKREVLLTKAKLHHSLFEHIMQERQLRTWKAQLKQGEPEFERLKKELEEVKHNHRGLDNTYRSQAEMERHRAQLADAAIEEQLEVQTAFREQGALLQSIYDRKQRAEYEMTRRETEIKQLQGWKGTVESLIDKFNALLAAQKEAAAAAGADGPAGDMEEGGERATGGPQTVAESSASWENGGASGHLSPDKYMQLVKLRSHVHKDVRKQLYGDQDDKQFFDSLKNEVKAIERRMEEARVVIQHLEMQLLNVACDDPGILVGVQLVLPVLQERLDAAGRDFAAERAKLAESEIIRMEAEQAQREAAERERRRAAKAAKKDKAKSEKEKEREAKEAKETAERQRREQAEQARAQREEEGRRKRQEQLEAVRRAEEEYMEQRRRELLSDENGYWRQRMRMEEERAATEAAVAALTSEDVEAVTAAMQQQQQHIHHQHHHQHHRSGCAAPHRGSGDGSDTAHRRRSGTGGQSAAAVASRKHGSPALLAIAATDAKDVDQGSAKTPRATAIAAAAAAQERDSMNGSDQTSIKDGLRVQQQPALAPPPAASPPPPPPPPGQQPLGTAAQPAPQPATAAPQPAAQLPPLPAEQPAPTVTPTMTPAIYFGAVAVSTAPPALAPEQQPRAGLPNGVLSAHVVQQACAAAPEPQQQLVVPMLASGGAPPPAGQLNPGLPMQPMPLPPAGAPQQHAAQQQQLQQQPQQQHAVPRMLVPMAPPFAPGLPHSVPPVANGGMVVPGPSGPIVIYPMGGAPLPPPQHVLANGHLAPLHVPGPQLTLHPPQAGGAAAPQANPAAVDGAGGVGTPAPLGGPVSAAPVSMPAAGLVAAAPSKVDATSPPTVSTLPSTGSDRMLNAAAKPFVPSMPKPQPAVVLTPIMVPIAQVPNPQQQPSHMQQQQQPPQPQQQLLNSGLTLGSPTTAPPMMNGGFPPPPIGPYAMHPHHPHAHMGLLPQMGMPMPGPGSMNAGPPLPAAAPQGVYMGPSPNAQPFHPGGPLPPPHQHQQRSAAPPPGGSPQASGIQPTLSGSSGGSTGLAGGAGSTGRRSMSSGKLPGLQQQPGPGGVVLPSHAQMATAAGGAGPNGGSPHAPPQPFMMLPNGMPPPMMDPRMAPHSMVHHGLPPHMMHLPPHQQQLLPHQHHQMPLGPAPPPMGMHLGTMHPMMLAGMHPGMLPGMHPGMGPMGMHPGPHGGMPPSMASPQQPAGAKPLHEQQHGNPPASPDGPLHPRLQQPSLDAMAASSSANSTVSSNSSSVASSTASSQQQAAGATTHAEALAAQGMAAAAEPAGGSGDGQPNAGTGGGPTATPNPAAKTWSYIAARESPTQHTSPGRSHPSLAEASQQQQAPAQGVASGQPQLQPQAMSGPLQPPAAPATPLPSQPAAPGSLSWKSMLQSNLGGPQGGSSASPGGAPTPAPAPRWAGTPPVGNFNAVPPTPLPARLRVTDSGLVVYEVPDQPPRSLQLVRGLRNGEGEYNCFLNVIIQSLWHLRPFREAMLAMQPDGGTAAAGAKGSSPHAAAEAQVLAALSSIFRAMAAPPSGGPSGGRTVSPAELRNALAALGGQGQAAMRVDMSDMHDAAEVWGHILECLHRAEASTSAPTTGGGSAPPQHDITLPQRVKQASAGRPLQPGSTVHRLFGSDMQVPCPPPDTNPGGEEESGGGSGGWLRQQQGQRGGPGKGQRGASTGQQGTGSGGGGLLGSGGQSGGGASQQQQQQASAGVAPQPQQSAGDVLQFTKFFHLVPAQGLRQALADATLPSGQVDCSWEQLILAAEAAGTSAMPGAGSRSPGGGDGAASAGTQPMAALLRRPKVFTLTIVWESPQVPSDAIRATLSAVGPQLEVPALFHIPPQAPAAMWPRQPPSASVYTLRAVVCYFGHHYLAFVLSEELGLWLCFDDAAISLVGRWPDVCRAMLMRRMQPSLLIYEDVAPATPAAGASNA